MVKNLPAMQETPIQSPGWPFSGEGNGHPLQYSCLWNSMDREAWQLQSVGTQSQTSLTLSLHFFSEHLQCCATATSIKVQRKLCVLPKGSVLWQYLWMALGHPDFAYLPGSLLPPSACTVCLARECNSSIQIPNMFANYDLTPLCSVAASVGVE